VQQIDKNRNPVLASKVMPSPYEVHEEVMGDMPAGEPTWRIARNCDTGACVEIGTAGDAVMIRNSVDPRGVCVTLCRDEWLAFVARVKEGVLDIR
jgi:hypothetical protein